MPRRRKPTRDRTSLIVSIAFHLLLVGAIAFWAYKSGKLEQLRQAVLQYVRPDKKEQKQSEPVQAKASAPTKLPPINQGLPPAPGSGTRRAVAADAPVAPGESFFQDTRQQVQGPGTPAPTPPAPSKAVPPAPKVTPPPAASFFGPPPPSSIKSLLQERSKSTAAIEAIGTEQISKSGSSDAGAVLNRVAGASIVGGKFAVIRGLGDRYVTTTLNGAEIPSADPYRRSASLDLFPAQIIDKVVVAKTYTPDKPGAYTGGGIEIVTKSFPEKPFLLFSLGTAYNTQTTGNDKFLTYSGGGKDWLGMDDGTRALPASVAKSGIPPKQANTGRPTSPNFSNNVYKATLLNKLTHDMGSAQFAPTQQAPPPDANFFLAAGDTTHFLERPLGVFASISYKNESRFYDDGVSQRYKPSGTNLILGKSFTDSRSLEVVNWSAMTSLATQWSENHQTAFNFFYNQNSESYARVQHGTNESDPGVLFSTYRLQWIERNLQSYQVKGSDVFPELGGSQLDWLVGLTEISQDEPDSRIFNMLTGDGTNYYTGRNDLPDPGDPTRYYRYLSEHNLNPKVDVTVPLRTASVLEGTFKTGLFSSSSERDFNERDIYYKSDIQAPFNGNPNTWLTPTNLGYTARATSGGNTNYFWNRYIGSFDSSYTASSTIRAGYAMADFPVWDGLRLVGGARLEFTDIQVDSKSYIENAVTGKRTNIAEIVQTDVLPAISLIQQITPELNLRLSYGKTVARPTFRELAAYRSYDPLLDVEVDGNPNLEMTSVMNYDARLEWYPRPGELLSVGFFYKSLTKPIEQQYISLVGDLVTWTNRDAGTVMGIEFEARKNLDCLDEHLRAWSLGGNLALMESETALTPAEYANKKQIVPGTSSTRPLYDQSPYLANVDLNYDNTRVGLSASLVFGIAGPRIAIASLTTPDIYEQPSPQLDFILGQRVGRRGSIKFTAKNLLNSPVKLTYGDSGKQLYSSYTRGITFGLSAAWEF